MSRKKLLAIIAAVMLALPLLSACFVEALTMQITQASMCGNTTKMSHGSLDISVTNKYYANVIVTNGLVMNADPMSLIPETNYITLQKFKVWIDYPKGFSLTGNPLLYTQNRPYEVPSSYRIDPGIPNPNSAQGAAAGALGGAAGGAAAGGGAVAGGGGDGGAAAGGGAGGLGASPAPGANIGFVAIPPETTAVLKTAAELKAKAGAVGFPQFVAVLNIEVSGVTGQFMELQSNTWRLPVTVCNGCMNQQKFPTQLATICQNASSTNNAQSTIAGLACIGQDGVCLPKATAAGNGSD